MLNKKYQTCTVGQGVSQGSAFTLKLESRSMSSDQEYIQVIMCEEALQQTEINHQVPCRLTMETKTDSAKQPKKGEEDIQEPKGADQ